MLSYELRSIRTSDDGKRETADVFVHCRGCANEGLPAFEYLILPGHLKRRTGDKFWSPVMGMEEGTLSNVELGGRILNQLVRLVCAEINSDIRKSLKR